MCLRTVVSIPAGRESRMVAVEKNILTPLSMDGAERWFKLGEFLYFPEHKMLCRYNRSMTDGVVHLQTLWNEDTVDLGSVEKTPVQQVKGFEIQPTVEGRELIAATVVRVCERQGLRRPVTYIAPGGAPRLTRATVKEVYGDRYGYRSAATYHNHAARVLNEPNPEGNAAYGMQWGDVKDEGPSLAALKKGVANQLALNKVVMIGCHTLMDPDYWESRMEKAQVDKFRPIWDNYFVKMDGLLAWIKAKEIPVKSHAEWAGVLYGENRTVLKGNCFPGLDRDLDEDGMPDGYLLVNGHPEAEPVGAGVPEAHVLTSENPGQIFRIHGLGGLPHGKAQVACWAKGPAGSTVSVVVHGVGTTSFVLKDGWQQYVGEVTIPAETAVVRVDCVWQGKVPGVVSVGGFLLKARE